MRYGIIAYLQAEAHDTMDDPDEYGRFLLDAKVRSEGCEVTGEPVVAWHQMTRAEWDLHLAMIRRHQPGTDWPGFDVGDWQVHAYAETSRSEPLVNGSM